MIDYSNIRMNMYLTLNIFTYILRRYLNAINYFFLNKISFNNSLK